MEKKKTSHLCELVMTARKNEGPLFASKSRASSFPHVSKKTEKDKGKMKSRYRLRYFHRTLINRWRPHILISSVAHRHPKIVRRGLRDLTLSREKLRVRCYEFITCLSRITRIINLREKWIVKRYKLNFDLVISCE